MNNDGIFRKPYSKPMPIYLTSKVVFTRSMIGKNKFPRFIKSRFSKLRKTFHVLL